MKLFRKTRSAYGAGKRAGLAGASHASCYYSMFEFMQFLAWYHGWGNGSKKRSIIIKGKTK